MKKIIVLVAVFFLLTAGSASAQALNFRTVAEATAWYQDLYLRLISEMSAIVSELRAEIGILRAQRVQCNPVGSTSVPSISPGEITDERVRSGETWRFRCIEYRNATGNNPETHSYLSVIGSKNFSSDKNTYSEFEKYQRDTQKAIDERNAFHGSKDGLDCYSY